jgi:hypothetical protein
VQALLGFPVVECPDRVISDVLSARQPLPLFSQFLDVLPFRSKRRSGPIASHRTA